MSSNVTAVSYGLKLPLPDIQRLRSLLTAAGLSVGAETRAGDARFEVYAADCALEAKPEADVEGALDAESAAPAAIAARLDGPRHALAAAGIDGVDTALVPAALRSAPR